MIIVMSAILGAALGALQARRRKGSTADILQYVVVFAILFALLGLFGSIIWSRTMAG